MTRDPSNEGSQPHGASSRDEIARGSAAHAGTLGAPPGRGAASAFVFEDSTDTSSPATAPPPRDVPPGATSFADETDVNGASVPAPPAMPDWLRARSTPVSAVSIGETTGEVRLDEGRPPTPFSPPSAARFLAPPPSTPTHAASAAHAGALGASNAAAGLDVLRFGAADRVHDASRPRPPVRRAAVQLLWFDRDVAQRVRTKSAWEPLLRELEDQPLDREADDYDARFSTQAVEDRRAVSEILSAGEASTTAFPELLGDAIQRPGRFVPPMVLLAGDLEPTFDERAWLTAVTSFVEPFRAADDELRAALEDAHALLRLPASLPPDVCASLAERVQKTFLRKRGASASYIEEQIGRTLLRDRAYARRRVLGGEHLRMVFRAGARVAPAYLPTSVSDMLPMFTKIPVRLVAEIEPRADGAEESPISLRIGAIARSLSLP